MKINFKHILIHLRFQTQSNMDSYTQFGGVFVEDSKDTVDFKYVTFTELPKFLPIHRSAMAKFLTPELFEKLKDVKSSKGYTLSNAIMTGVVTPHLGVGSTAGDEECWDLFKELYYPIIKEWHGYDAETQVHPMDLDPSKLEFTDEQKLIFNKYAASTRIRAARNVSGFSLPAGTSVEDRAGVEEVVKQAFAGLTGELSGKYYELGSLTDEQRDFLLEKGYLFQIPTAKNLLTGAGAARSWPDNRGIFHNEAQTALAWVNEEDHCRIISMELGGDIPSVFTRFCALSNAIKISAEANGAKLMWNEKLGFLGTCPSNLGTGLRASVMVCLPQFNKLMEGENHADKELLDTVCSAFDLQPRGSSGEHSPAVGAKFDVSNKQRLGLSEVQLVQKMINGVSKVIEFEELLAGGATPDDIRFKIAIFRSQVPPNEVFESLVIESLVLEDEKMPIIETLPEEKSKTPLVELCPINSLVIEDSEMPIIEASLEEVSHKPLVESSAIKDENVPFIETILSCRKDEEVSPLVEPSAIKDEVIPTVEISA